MSRLGGLPTLRVRPERPVTFLWRGKPVAGVEGDTIATALFANGVRIFGRSLKYHRPRGLYSLDGECANALVNVDGVPNTPAELTPVRAGMDVRPQNVAGTPEHDAMAVLDRMSPLMPAGFYYKTMHKPAFIWPLAIKGIRKAAGLGKLDPDKVPPSRNDQIHPSADVAVIGGGPAGMEAALAAAENGKRVVLFEARPWLGGSFDYRGDLHDRSAELVGRLENHANIRVFAHAPVIGVYRDHRVTAVQTGGPEADFDFRYVEVRPRAVVVATGCIERPLLFDHNERPGVMQVDCALRLARTWGLLPGKNAVFSVGHDFGLSAALELKELGLPIAAVADVRTDGQDPALLERLEQAGLPVRRGWTAREARGRKAVEGVILSSVDGGLTDVLKADLLVASAGMTPVTGPLALAGAELAYDDWTGFFLPAAVPAGFFPAGRMLGLDAPEAVEASGRMAGLRAAGAESGEIKAVEDLLTTLPGPVRGAKFLQAPTSGAKTFICFDEDTTVKNLRQAAAEGFDVPELIKRYTAAGTGPGQSGIPGHNLALWAARYNAHKGYTAPPTTVRPPLRPVRLSALAGPNHDMCKRTPLHNLQEAAGGVMQRAGVWRRARRFSAEPSARAEIEMVRNRVGLIDVSTLGKFRLFGPDAEKALQRVYVSDMGKVKEGRVTYSAMVNDDACLIDDGVVTRVGENDYYLTSSTGRAGQTAEWFRYHARYENWDFAVVNLTDAFGAINLAGPEARKVLEKVTDADVSNEAFPFMGYRTFTVAGGVPARVMRLGFVGELSYELHVPASQTVAVWEALLEAGKEFGIGPFGLEAQSTLRLEKGHVIIGQESEQRTTLHDLGMGWLWHRDKPEAKTVGDPALRQTEKQRDRLTLVGIELPGADRAPRDGSPVVDQRIRGYVCTARYSVALGKPVGLALVDQPLAKAGTSIAIYEDGCGGRTTAAVVAEKPFYDPDGRRMRS
ncbi:MAG: 2Fe-2S iron-sulfur cluster-binding protein [Desulfococcaceae bacterium]